MTPNALNVKTAEVVNIMAAENRGPELAAVVIALLVLAITTVGLRCYVRRVLLKVFFAEDWLAVVTLVCPNSRKGVTIIY